MMNTKFSAKSVILQSAERWLKLNFIMKIQKIASSTVIITTDDCKILCDPWIENGEYFGS